MKQKQAWWIFLASFGTIFISRVIYYIDHLGWHDLQGIGLYTLPLIVVAICAGRLAYLEGHGAGRREGIAQAAQGARWTSRAAYALADSMPREEVREDGSSFGGAVVASDVDTAIEGKLGQLVVAAQERFWNRARGFDPSDRDTFSSQDTIIEWIKEQQPGISNVKAKAVEMVACPIDR